ncbi:RAB6-interacting golgin-like isoform X2 [Ciona intestinalis]
MEQNVEKPKQKKDGIVLDDETGKKKEKLKLEDAQQRQKQMEEMNRRKKAMLTKEIAERKKRAIAESSKLVKIQSELTKLDQLLNVDVSILRDQIDEACWEFSQAQRRFQQAEKEYIASKMDLHGKTTRKEDLTEHLFNIIQANEERKAKKLEELMVKLNLEEEELELREKERKEKDEKREKEERERKKKEEKERKEKEEKEKIEKEEKEMEEKAKLVEVKDDNTSVTNESVENVISNENLHGANTTPVVVPENN